MADRVTVMIQICFTGEEIKVDIERLFTNTGPIMVNESDTFSKWRASRSIFCDKGHLNVKKRPNT